MYESEGSKNLGKNECVEHMSHSAHILHSSIPQQNYFFLVGTFIKNIDEVLAGLA